MEIYRFRPSTQQTSSLFYFHNLSPEAFGTKVTNYLKTRSIFFFSNTEATT